MSGQPVKQNTQAGSIYKDYNHHSLCSFGTVCMTFLCDGFLHIWNQLSPQTAPMAYEKFLHYDNLTVDTTTATITSTVPATTATVLLLSLLL